MNRLQFIKNTSLATGAILFGGIASLASPKYVLHADGKTCDADAITAWWKGKDVYYNGKKLTEISGKKMAIRKPLMIDNSWKSREGFSKNRIISSTKEGFSARTTRSEGGVIDFGHTVFEISKERSLWNKRTYKLVGKYGDTYMEQAEGAL